MSCCRGTGSRTQVCTGSNTKIQTPQLSRKKWVVGPPDEEVYGPLRVVKGAYGGAPRWAPPTLDNSSRPEIWQLSAGPQRVAPGLCT
jgi:hypothetical protein